MIQKNISCVRKVRYINKERMKIINPKSEILNNIKLPKFKCPKNTLIPICLGTGVLNLGFV
jgi:hypothetical protein